MKKVKIFGIILAAGFVILILLTTIKREDSSEQPFVRAEMSDFSVDVEAKGEIEAGSSVTIYMPEMFFTRKIRLRRISISELIAEGTFVKKGDYVATLDHTVVEEKIKEIEESIQKMNEELQVAILDSAVKLNNFRNDLEQYRMEVKENKIIREQSVYESKAVQRKSEINVQQAERKLENALNNYQRTVIYERSKIKNMETRLKSNETVRGYYMELMDDLKIYAPESGLLIYARNYRGEKIKTGTELNRYSSTNNRVALLPNLDSLISVTYVNEIDITKVYDGQPVEITVEAVPDQVFKGEVIHISRMGKKSNDNGSKVFQVDIHILDTNGELKPAMSTTNRLLLDDFEDVIILPVNAIYAENHKHYVYVKNGLNTVKKEVQLGMQDENKVIVEMGVNKGDKCLIQEPEDLEKIKIIPLETAGDESSPQGGENHSAQADS